ncbi:MAG: hypothetical protein A2Z25_19280 [Planctomycetes bacterium RBG_16_55_9]|nr:MAG: hypothetical protein A2Z25_19280 [Planctomycetes bacterium RBG_16_55_9]
MKYSTFATISRKLKNMFSPMLSILIIPFLAAMFLAINMGGSGTSPSFAAAYGSNIVRKDSIPVLFGAFVFLGAIIAGKKVALTIGKDIVDIGPLGATFVSILTASLLLAASVTKGIPTSLVQLNTAAIIGLGICKAGYKPSLARPVVRRMLGVWIVAPFISLGLSFLLTVAANEIGLL